MTSFKNTIIIIYHYNILLCYDKLLNVLPIVSIYFKILNKI